MRPTAVLVNTSRGPVVDTDALADALRDGTIWAAALDVTDPEPLPADHPLVTMDNCLVVPHIASASRDDAWDDGGDGRGQPPGRSARGAPADAGQPGGLRRVRMIDQPMGHNCT